MAGTYGMPGIVVDGQDVVAVAETVAEAVARARRGEGPSLIECKTVRLRPHAEGLPDDRPPELLAEMRTREPVALFRDKLLALGALTEALARQIDEEAAQEMAEAERFALESPKPDPAGLLEGLYAV
jgi:pyruvate dehydrogenase E1 component alpha subunit